ncbi:hypothetical protein HMPREF9946_02530 [Acetobacteraceae bacterium AT-5844]|nr:hypothetical protein HMPREF9946_02530 [Acetobacteraceae bacterium AT-5844]
MPIVTRMNAPVRAPLLLTGASAGAAARAFSGLLLLRLSRPWA